MKKYSMSPRTSFITINKCVPIIFAPIGKESEMLDLIKVQERRNYVERASEPRVGEC